MDIKKQKIIPAADKTVHPLLVKKYAIICSNKSFASRKVRNDKSAV
jgi:hypothetical protein